MTLNELVLLSYDLKWWLLATSLAFILTLDHLFFQAKEEKPSFRKALSWTFVWILLATAFGYWISLSHSLKSAEEYATAYLLEWLLSVDNVFVFAVIFRSFAVGRESQHRILFWGVMGAFLMRILFLFLGVELIHRVSWIIFVFAAVLIWTGFRMFKHKEKDFDPKASPAIKLVSRFLPIAQDAGFDRFFVIKENGKRYGTPALVVLLIIESSDLLFAIDSIPAVLGISRSLFILAASNLFAIAGLRSLYFVVDQLMDGIEGLEKGLAFILVLLGIDMAWEHATQTEFLSKTQFLCCVGIIIGSSFVYSHLRKKV